MRSLLRKVANISTITRRIARLWTDIHEKSPEVWLWTDWPKQFRNPRSAAVRNFAAKHRNQYFVLQVPAVAA